MSAAQPHAPLPIENWTRRRHSSYKHQQKDQRKPERRKKSNAHDVQSRLPEGWAFARSQRDATRDIDSLCRQRHEDKLPPLVTDPNRRGESLHSAGLNFPKLRGVIRDISEVGEPVLPVQSRTPLKLWNVPDGYFYGNELGRFRLFLRSFC